MGLPNIGPMELILVLAIALLVVGPRRLPELGSTVGRTIREFRKTASGITDPLVPELEPDKTAVQPTTDAPTGATETSQTKPPETGADRKPDAASQD